MSDMRLTFFLLFLSSSMLQAQSVHVTEIDGSTPIPDVYIFSEKKNRSVITDSEGAADVKSLLPCDSLYLRHTAYVSVAIKATELGKQTHRLSLARSAYSVAPVKIVTARERLINSPKQVHVLEAEEIARYEARTTADLLQATGEVFVQRSQLGGGSPILRGFEANRILLMIDGVRLNNAIYRSGHLQNAISVDPFLLESTEVIFGPASLIYGSDALGGVIHFKTRSPRFISEGAKPFSMQAAQRFTSATQEYTTHWDMGIAGKKISWIGSVTKAEYGVVTMGENRMHGDQEWGLIPEYVTTIGGQDSIIPNPNPSSTPNSGYTQYDLAQKVSLALQDSTRVSFNVQYSTSTDVPRSDQLAAYRDNRLRYGEWSYGPQKRLLSSLQLDLMSQSTAYDKGTIILAYQEVGEDRFTRNYRSVERFVRKEDVSVFSINADLVKRIKDKDVYYGLEITSNDVQSQAYIENIATGNRVTGPTRYPDGGSRMSTISAYVDLNTELSKKLIANIGLRYAQTYLDSKYNDTTFYSLPFKEIIFNNGALTGSASLFYTPTKDWELGLTAGTGFRSPNVDDYGKIFERKGIVVVPTNQLQPEYTLNGDVRIARKFSEGKSKVEAGTFYTHILDAIVQRNATLDGNDSFFYEGSLAQIAVNENAEEAYIYGWSAGLKLALTEHWTWSNTASQTIGRVVAEDTPLSHIPPFFAKSAISRNSDIWSVSGYVIYNDTKLASDIGQGRSDNADQGLGGTYFPSWYTLHLQAGTVIAERLHLRLNLDNLLDVHYKGFASGISAPGRSASVTIRFSV